MLKVEFIIYLLHDEEVQNKNSALWSSKIYSITKQYLYNFDPLKPHFYIAKLGFTEVYIIFLISDKKHR